MAHDDETVQGWKKLGVPEPHEEVEDDDDEADATS